jgi:hypothetical protein
MLSLKERERPSYHDVGSITVNQPRSAKSLTFRV